VAFLGKGERMGEIIKVFNNNKLLRVIKPDARFQFLFSGDKNLIDFKLMK
jgi:hypothetical protein